MQKQPKEFAVLHLSAKIDACVHRISGWVGWRQNQKYQSEQEDVTCMKGGAGSEEEGEGLRGILSHLEDILRSGHHFKTYWVGA